MSLDRGTGLRSDLRYLLLMWGMTLVLFGPAIWRVVSAGALMSTSGAGARVERAVKIGTRSSSRTTGTRTCLSLYRY